MAQLRVAVDVGGVEATSLAGVEVRGQQVSGEVQGAGGGVQPTRSAA